MGKDNLKVIATELVTRVHKRVTIDWTLRESARAKIKVLVKRIEIRSLPTHSLHSRFYVDHSHCAVLAPATLAALPSTRAIPDRDVFYVAHPARSILRKHGYPPDLQDEATKLFLQQAELLCAEWAA